MENYKELTRRVKAKSGKVYTSKYLVLIREKKGVPRISKSGKLYYNYYKRRETSTFPATKLMRIACLERDGYKCVHCGKTTTLRVHHKDGKSWCKTRLDANNSLDNLITLCNKCHLTIYHTPLKRSLNSQRMIKYHLEHPEMMHAELARRFNLSRERVGQLLGRGKYDPLGD